MRIGTIYNINSSVGRALLPAIDVGDGWRSGGQGRPRYC